MKDDSNLLRLAEDLADGKPVDWESESGSSDDPRLKHLRLVESVAQVMRESAGDVSGGPEAEPTSIPSWGHLQIRERLGRGGFAEVFRAWDADLEREVALKLLRRPAGDDGAQEKFLSEARRLARVRHPNVLTVHGVDQHVGRNGLWTDLIEGQTLEQRLEDHGPFGAEEAALIGIDLCRALAAVHAQDLIHGDVKTTNVIREVGGKIVLMDFGCSAERYRNESIEGPQPLSGTPVYMAPELFLGAQRRPQTDIYALGVLLYRLVSGLYPANRANPDNVLERGVPLRDLRPEISGAFVQAVEKALEPMAEDRFASAGEMERALRAALGASDSPLFIPTPKPDGDTPEPPAPPVAKHRGAWWAAAAVLTLVAAAFALPAVRQALFGPFEVEASLFRRSQGIDQRLSQGASLDVGDKLFLEVRGSKPMYVYVLNQDAAGRGLVLFPLPSLDVQNPLPAGERHRLPGPVEGVHNYWDVDSAGGDETVLVFASRTRLDDLERQLEAVPQAGAARPRGLPVADANTVIRLRGLGGLSPDPTETTDLTDIAGGLAVRASQSSGLWMWELRLRNPG